MFFSDKALSRLMAGKSGRERHAHFADDVYLEREENSEKAHEEDELEFKKKQRRRSSVAHLPLGFASLRRLSTASGDCESLPSSLPNSGGSRHFVWGARGAGPLPRQFFQSFIKNGVFWSILMSKCASHVYTCIAYFHSVADPGGAGGPCPPRCRTEKIFFTCNRWNTVSVRSRK